MKALLLAAGLGTRLRPITNTVPKCLVPINSKPLLEYWLDNLLPHGIDRVLINTHYLASQVHNFVLNSNWCDRIDLVHEIELLGTGGTILKNKDYLEDSAFLICHADNLSRFNVQDFINQHIFRPNGVEITMMTFETDSPQSCGIVEIDSRGIVIEFHEKIVNPPSNIANAAVYIFEPSVINFIISLNKKIIDISTEVLPFYMGKIITFKNSDYHRDIGTLESLAIAEKDFK